MKVMKFGGTSVGSAAAIRSLIEIVTQRLSVGNQEPSHGILVVVSAASKVTDSLLSAAQAVVGGADVEVHFAPVRTREEQLLADLGLAPDFNRALLDEIHQLLCGIGMLGELTPRTLDRLASYGERMSARRLAAAFELAGQPARAYDAWDLGMRTDSNFGEARIQPDAEARMREAWNRLPVGELAITTGFIGQDAQGAITTLGRGGSDLSASLFGAGMGAEEIQIWTDVSGIMTCDPRLVPQAYVVPQLSFSEAAELAYFGAKVLHPRTIEPATRVGIPVLVLNTFKPEDAGSRITGEVSGRPGRPIGLAAQRGVQVINIHSSGMLDSSGYLSRLFGVFSAHSTPIDVIATSEVNVSVTVHKAPQALQELLADLEVFARASVQPDMAIICMVGEGLRDTHGMAGRIFSAMGDVGVNIAMISQGASEINVTFVVRNQDCETALRALHQRFFEAGT